MALTISEANLIGLVIESIFYGLLVSLTAASWKVLAPRYRSGQRINGMLMATSLAMFALATVHIVLDCRRMIIATYQTTPTSGGSDAYLNLLAEPLSVSKNAIYVAQTMLADSFIIYRVHAVWNSERRVIAPLLVILVGNLICGVGLVVAFARAVHPTLGYYNHQIGHWALSFLSMSMAINVICTGMISWKIYLSERRISRSSIHRSRSLSPVIVIMIESGAIYTCSLACQLATYVLNSYVLAVIQAAMTSLIGVVYTLIIVRVGLGLAPSNTFEKFVSRTGPVNGDNSGGFAQPIAVEMTRTRIVRLDANDTSYISQAEVGSSRASNVEVKTDAKEYTGDGSL